MCWLEPQQKAATVNFPVDLSRCEMLTLAYDKQKDAGQTRNQLQEEDGEKTNFAPCI